MKGNGYVKSINVSKSVKSVFSTVFRKKFHSTAYKHWKFPPKLFRNNDGKDGFGGFGGVLNNFII